jgi:hypothetical protein
MTTLVSVHTTVSYDNIEVPCRLFQFKSRPVDYKPTFSETREIHGEHQHKNKL